ncbi:MAG: hypothetical protein M1827_005795 [Pycnora praestabilis]|nr:MAG: hypothetical protein M1827_005795 [Pycnora praestabilis]
MLYIALSLIFLGPAVVHGVTGWIHTTADLAVRNTNSSSYCCSRLSSRLGSLVSYPNETIYQSEQNGTNGYWTQQEESVSPACRITPTCAQDVSIAVVELARAQCQFAIRSGGHTSWAGAANIQDGVTIDLSSLNQVNVSANNTVTSVGAGARWGDVYLKLDALNLATSGGRVAQVGVGGLTTGGGNSFFAARYGFVCDNVVNHQVVLSDGRIVDANVYENPDLHRALKGGNNNFGIVTRFDLKTFEQGKLWGGFIVYPNSTFGQQIQALQDFTTASGAGVDPYAAVINAYVYSAAAGIPIIANQYTYTKAEAFPAILQNFTNIQPQYSSTLRTTNLTDLTVELGEGTPNGFRQLFATATFGNDAGLFAALYNISNTLYTPVKNASNFQISFVLQPISKAILSASALAGQNVLGLSPSDGNLVWLDLTVQWSDEKDDAAINAATEAVVDQSIAYAKTQGLYNQYIYLNYALQSQDPIASYGQRNQALLRQISRQYDPEQVFQRLVPGGFKLFR